MGWLQSPALKALGKIAGYTAVTAEIKGNSIQLSNNEISIQKFAFRTTGSIIGAVIGGYLGGIPGFFAGGAVGLTFNMVEKSFQKIYDGMLHGATNFHNNINTLYF